MLHLALVVSRDLDRVESIEGPSKILSLPKDSPPAEAGLHAFEDKKLEELGVVVKWNPPLEVVVCHVKGVSFWDPVASP